MKNRVLIVDDEEVNLDILRKLLADDYDVATADSGESCLELVDEFSPDLVLLDIMLPGIDGYEACRRINAATCDRRRPQIILISSKASTKERLQGYKAGADDYVCKPFDHDELIAKVRVHIRLWNVLAELGAANANMREHSDDLELMVQERSAVLQITNDQLRAEVAERRRAEVELRGAKKQLETLARELAEVNVDLAHKARVDPLTSLFNRSAWQEIAHHEQERAKRYQRQYAIIMIDVDHFKGFNDSQGHHAGDECLRKVARCIAAQSRGNEIVGRYGGEEFIILAPETDVDGGRALAERIRDAIMELNIEHPASPTADRVTASLGVAGGIAHSWLEIAEGADKALYAAKKGGRNQVRAAQTTETAADAIAPSAQLGS